MYRCLRAYTHFFSLLHYYYEQTDSEIQVLKTENRLCHVFRGCIVLNDFNVDFKWINGRSHGQSDTQYNYREKATRNCSLKTFFSEK